MGPSAETRLRSAAVPLGEGFDIKGRLFKAMAVSRFNLLIVFCNQISLDISARRSLQYLRRGDERSRFLMELLSSSSVL